VARLLGAASLLAAGNIASRLLGFVRMRTITSLFGLGLQTDAFLAAAKVPTAIYNLLVGGQLSAALVPVLSGYAAKEEERAQLWRAASVLATVAAALLSALALAVYVFAPRLALWLTPDYGAEGIAIVTGSLRWMAPAVVVFGLAGVVTGLLLSLERFSLPAAAGAAYNAAMIITILLMHDRLGVYALPLGVLVGSLGQLALLLPGLRDASLRPVFDPRHPALRRVLRLYAPIGLGLLVTDVALPAADVRLAAAAGNAARGTLDVATQLTQFPHGLIAVAISMAILPALSGAHARGEGERFARTLSRGLRTVLALALPAAVGLAVLAEPVTGAVFQAGAFDAADRAAVAVALSAYLLGLPFAAIDWPLNYAFYARHNTWLPALVGVGSVLVWLAVALALGPLELVVLPEDRRFMGLALADSAKHGAHALVMLLLVRKALGGSALKGLLRTLLAAGGAAALMGLLVAGLDRELALWLPAGTGAFVARTAVGAGLGAAVYLPLAARLGVEEVGWIVGMLRQRLGR
jgi:putative peptidoglycan lipid II flippase